MSFMGVVCAGHARRHVISRIVACGLLVGGVGAILGCSEISKAGDPGIVQPSANNDSVGAVGRRAGAIATFATAFGDQVVGSGVIADELGSPHGTFEGDQRINTANSAAGYPYDRLSSARIDLIRAINSLESWAPAPAWHVAELYAYLGNVEVFFAENMCSGVPLGVVTNDLPGYGATATRDSLLRLAIADFDSATSYASSSDSVANLAAVGRGRALLDSGDFAGAAAAVSGVPAAFVYGVDFAGTVSGGSQQNPIYFYSGYYAQEINVSDLEGVNGLNFVSAGDPRVVTGTANGVTVGLADSNAMSPLVLASGIEARLIQAEAALRGGAVQPWAAALNGLRQSAIVPAMDTLISDSTTGASGAERVAVMFRERAFWLFLTGHRHGDLRRLVRQYGLPTESVFPTGPYEGGPAVYGTAVVYQPFGEQYNPNFHGCLSVAP
jgi:hypothetical protein